MAKRDINAEIQTRIESFADELSDLIREAALQAVQEALTGDQPAPRAAGRKKAPASKKSAARGPAKRSTRTASGRRVRRTEEEIAELGKVVLAHVKANDGHRLEEIGSSLGIETANLKRPIANLLEAKALKTTGARRGTKYHVGRATAKRK